MKERKEIMLIILVLLGVYCVGLVSGVVCVCFVNVGAAGNKRLCMICKETDVKCRKPMEERNDGNQDHDVRYLLRGAGSWSLRLGSGRDKRV